MDFFTHQDAARKASRRLTVLFVLAVIAVVVAVNVVSCLALQSAQPVVIGFVTLATLALIIGGTAFKLGQLSDGGSAVAEMLGGRRITNATSDLPEKRLINVVEEMALASGVPVPLVYVMDEEATLNAFAAGYSPNDAAIAVTRGLMRSLNRDELQGVIGHEFSHILNGDMRLNVRMIGLLFGIEMIGHSGRVLARIARDADGRVAAALFSFGGALYVIGYVGVLASNMIRAAIGRQREYLADASAVQFTRNPEGIGVALIKIATESGLIAHRNADEVSHMFIASALNSRLDGAFATHPPIEKRIERVLGANAKLRLREAKRGLAARAVDAVAPMERAPLDARISGAFGRSAMAPAAVSPDSVLQSVGQPQAQHVDYAKVVLGMMPAAIRDGLDTSEGAKAVVVALLVADAKPESNLMRLAIDAGETRAAELSRTYGQYLGSRNPMLRLPIVSLALPSLRALPRTERAAFVALARKLVAADGRITPFEFALTALLARALGDEASTGRAARYSSLAPLQADVAIVLSLFVRLASEGSVLFDRLMGSLDLAGERLLPPSAIKMEQVEAALAHIAELAPLVKPRFIKACLEAVMADGKINAREAELMRAVCATLDAPLPPIIDTQLAGAIERPFHESPTQTAV
jgi:Zn-dependent protease with chaperone function/uncharacterized tellurite resistance protein B-like protein